MIEDAGPETVRDDVVPISEPSPFWNCAVDVPLAERGSGAQSDLRFCGAKKLPGQDPLRPCMRASPIKSNMIGGASGGRKEDRQSVPVASEI